MIRLILILTLFATSVFGQFFNPTTKADIERAGGALLEDVIAPNPAVIITNNSTWDGWTTTGVLIDGEILLGSVGDWLLSPVYSNGIGDISEVLHSSQNGTDYQRNIYTNGALSSESAPYKQDNGQVRYEVLGALPGSTLGLYVSNVVVTSYTDLMDARSIKEFAAFRVIDAPDHPMSVVNKKYADHIVSAAEGKASAALAEYAADGSKEGHFSRIRIGGSYAVETADSWQIANDCTLSGEGELIATSEGVGIAKNGETLLSVRSESSGLFLTNANFSTWVFEIATNGISGTPFLEWSESLVDQDWQKLPDTGVYTNGIFQITVESPPDAQSGFVRARQPGGDSAVVVSADVIDMGQSAIRWRNPTNNAQYVDVYYDFSTGQLEQQAGTE